jgi:hypothetical protein
VCGRSVPSSIEIEAFHDISLKILLFFKEREQHALHCQEKNSSMRIFLSNFFASNFLTGHCWVRPAFGALKQADTEFFFKTVDPTEDCGMVDAKLLRRHLQAAAGGHLEKIKIIVPIVGIVHNCRNRLLVCRVDLQ